MLTRIVSLLMRLTVVIIDRLSIPSFEILVALHSLLRQYALRVEIDGTGDAKQS